MRASVTHRFNSYWSANVFTRYDTKATELDEIGGYVQYDLDCLAFRLTSGYVPAITRYDGTRRSADFNVSFFVWGKEKLIAMDGEHPSLTEFRRKYYSGRSVASELASRGSSFSRG